MQQQGQQQQQQQQWQHNAAVPRRPIEDAAGAYMTRLATATSIVRKRHLRRLQTGAGAVPGIYAAISKVLSINACASLSSIGE